MSLDILIHWFDDNKLQWNKDALSIQQIDGSFSVVASKDLKKEETLVKIPKQVVLSTKTCGISNIIDEANLEGGCALTLAVLYELAQKENSPWFGYLQALPRQEIDLPMFWEEDEKEWFKGTEMENSVYNDLADLEDDYNDLIEPLLEEHPYIFLRDKEDSYSFEKFVRASTLISSRSFEVDAFHETALVPFADLFNHHEKEHVHFQTEFEVCEACGVLDFCEHQYFNFLEEDENDQDNDDGEGDWEDEDKEDGEDMEEDEEETELPDLEALEKENVDFWEKDEDDEEEEKDSCDMVLDKNIKKDEEIFNTYGDHPNVALLSKYGFCYDNNKNDYISISEDSIVDCCLAITLEILKAKHPKASKEELEQMAVNETRPRWELFLRHEQLLCPSQGGKDEGHDDFEEEEDCQDGCCDDDHGDHKHGEHEDEHIHDEEGGCCGEEEEEGGPSRPYFVNYEGLFEDKVMCLLHIMFVDRSKFKSFVENVDNALEYFDQLSKNKDTKSLVDVKRMVYQACHALVDFRRMEYFEDNGEWKPVTQDIEERKQIETGSRKYYAMTCRINEKKIVERSVSYYDNMVKSTIAPSSSNKKQKGSSGARK
ncbi:unnamed protein product [Rhizopus stolonifer]